MPAHFRTQNLFALQLGEAFEVFDCHPARLVLTYILAFALVIKNQLSRFLGVVFAGPCEIVNLLRQTVFWGCGHRPGLPPQVKNPI